VHVVLRDSVERFCGLRKHPLTPQGVYVAAAPPAARDGHIDLAGRREPPHPEPGTRYTSHSTLHSDLAVTPSGSFSIASPSSCE